MNPTNARASVAAARLLALLDDCFEETLPPLQPQGASTYGVDRLVESMRYSLRTPGKRIRPLLLLAAAETLGADAARFVRFAVGIEMIHAYSLIHDDLPAMDDDDLRRGLPTNHVVYGDGMAILAGDALLTEAFVVMLEPVAEPRAQVRAIEEIARAAGREGMVGGQAADLLAEGIEGDASLLQAIHARKTGALLRVAVRAGALLAGVDEGDLALLTTFGERFGLAFQIADDIKDETAPTSVTGKREGGDRRSGKMTYPALFGIERSLALLRVELDAAFEAVAPLSRDPSLLLHVAADSVALALAQAEA